MASFGARIRRERQRLEITLADVSQATKINLQYLNALERNDFQKLPGGVFNRGYIRAYAQFIGADPEALVRAYVAEEKACGVEDRTQDLELLRSSLAAAMQRQAQKGRSARRRRRARILAVATLLTVVALALASWYYLEPHPRERDRVYATVAGWFGVLDAPRDSPVAKPPVVEPEHEPGTLPAGDVTMVDTERTRRTAPADVDDSRMPIASREAGPSSLVEVDLYKQEQEKPVIADDSSRLSVSDFGVGAGLVNHELQGRSDQFEEGSVVWFWTRVIGGHAGEIVRHVWYHENNQVGLAELTIGGPNWRTQSRRPLEPGSGGRWRVEIRDSQDRLLAREQFVCVPVANVAAQRHHQTGVP